MPLAATDSFAKNTVAAIQEYSILAGRAVTNMFSGPRYWADIFTQMDSIGIGSVPIVILTGFFTALRAGFAVRNGAGAVRRRVKDRARWWLCRWSRSSVRCSRR